MIKAILEQHALEAAFLWHQREAAVAAPNHDLASLEELDERLEAHLDGLRVAGDEGWAVCTSALPGGEAGEIFTAAVLAAEQGAGERLAAVLDLAGGSRDLGRGVTSALGFLPLDRAAPALAALLATDRPASHRRLGIAAHAAHRHDPGAALTNALFDDDALLLEARALRAVGELGRADLLPEVRRALGAEHPERRLWAAWSAVILGEPAGVAVLWTHAEGGGPLAARACATAARTTDPRTGAERLRSLASFPEHARTAIAGAGALGDPVVVPLLIEAMGDPRLARLAGEAFTTITGARIAGSLAGRAPDAFVSGPSDDPADADVAMDPDAALPWPSPDAVRGAWNGLSQHLRRGARYLLGEPITPELLRRILRDGDQRQRAGAAEALALRAPGAPLFEVRAPAARQRRALAAAAD